MTHQAITDLNDTLARTHSNYDIIEYIKRINRLHEEPIDLSFIEELLSFVERDECCIPHTLLVKYGVLSGNNTNKISTNTIRLLEQYDLTEGEDFKRLNVEALGNNKKTYHKKNYMLHPNAFRLCLIRSGNTKNMPDIIYYLRNVLSTITTIK
jgi:hypothetical protein